MTVRKDFLNPIELNLHRIHNEDYDPGCRQVHKQYYNKSYPYVGYSGTVLTTSFYTGKYVLPELRTNNVLRGLYTNATIIGFTR